MKAYENQASPRKAEFDDFADRYEEILKDPIRDRFGGDPLFFHRTKFDILVNHLGQTARRPEELEWLDVGCGTGELLQLGGASFSRACGCDVSEESLKYCGEIAVKVQNSPESIPFPDQSFDVVTAACVFHHVELARRSLLIESMARVLRPGGVICIFEHNPWNPVTQVIVKRCPVDVNAILVSSGECARLLRGSGLNVDATRYYLFFPESLEWWREKLEPRLRRVPLGGQYALIGSKQS
jgi:ubiquinone/menaquinone biosynthesis C-methylase UbiE